MDNVTVPDLCQELFAGRPDVFIGGKVVVHRYSLLVE
jgi:hypothetical protein